MLLKIEQKTEQWHHRGANKNDQKIGEVAPVCGSSRPCNQPQQEVQLTPGCQQVTWKAGRRGASGTLLLCTITGRDCVTRWWRAPCACVMPRSPSPRGCVLRRSLSQRPHLDQPTGSGGCADGWCCLLLRRQWGFSSPHSWSRAWRSFQSSHLPV